MTRGHAALQVLADIVAELDKAGPTVKSMLAAYPAMNGCVGRARLLVELAAAARMPGTASDLGLASLWCPGCQAIHVSSAPGPESTGARRT